MKYQRYLSSFCFYLIYVTTWQFIWRFLLLGVNVKTDVLTAFYLTICCLVKLPTNRKIIILNLTFLVYKAESEAASTSQKPKAELGAVTAKLESEF